MLIQKLVIGPGSPSAGGSSPMLYSSSGKTGFLKKIHTGVPKDAEDLYKLILFVC